MAGWSPLLSTEDVAEVLAVSSRTVRRWAAAGTIPAVRAGGDWRFDSDALAAALVASEEARWRP